jgi:hypothetical protein
MNWLEALKKWNAGRDGAYTVPRKGTPEHAEVKEMMEGGSKRPGGYVKLLWAKKVQGKTPEDYDPPAREKKSAKSFNIRKITGPSATAIERFGTESQKKALAKKRDTRAVKREAFENEGMTAEELDALVDEFKEASKVKKAPRKRTTAVATEPKPDMRDFFKPKAKTGGAKVRGRKIRRVVPRKKQVEYEYEYEEDEEDFPTTTSKGKRYSAEQARKDRAKLGLTERGKKAKKPPVKEQGQVSMMMRIGNHVMIAEPQPATIKVRGDLSSMATDADYPTSGVTFGDDKPRATTASQARRQFTAEETRVRPLSELFMSKPMKGLVEEQLAGKGSCCWWKRELQEF